jgi:hypothetical protein
MCYTARKEGMAWYSSRPMPSLWLDPRRRKIETIDLDPLHPVGSSDFDIFLEIQYASFVFGLALKS